MLLCMYAAYRMSLASVKHLRFNRVMLMSSYALSVVLPLFWLIDHEFGLFSFGSLPAAAVSGNHTLLPVAAENSPDLHTMPTVHSSWAPILLGVYFSGVIIATIHMIVTGMRLMHIVRNGERHEITSRHTLILTEDPHIAPFSWRKYIVMSHSDYQESGRLIMTHEIKHIEARHWLDLYVAQFFMIFQWYNPGAWLMREELKAVHEYQADDAVISSGVLIYDYQILLIKKAVGARFPSLANSLNHSQLKKRVNMMYKTSSSKWSRLRSLALAPAAAVAVLTFSVPAVASLISATSDAEIDLIQDKVSENTPIVHASDSADGIDSGASVTDDEETVYKSAQKMPAFPGGETELLKALYYSIIYPPEALSAGKQGSVIVQFVIRSNGKVTSPRILRSVDPLLDAEALRVVSTLPDFIPATIDDKPVAVYYTLPIKFSLVTSDSTEKSK